MTVRIGLVGLGMMGRTHLDSYRKIGQAKVVALCDRMPERLAPGWAAPTGNVESGAAGRLDLSGVRATLEFADLLADPEVDAVDLCVPTDLHAPMARRALGAGKHVICEKPLALRTADAWRTVEAAHEAGRLLLVGHCLRFWPEYVMLKEMIESGRYGPARRAVLTRLGCLPDWSAEGWLADSSRSGSAALDLHVHDADVVRWFFGPPVEISSRGLPAPDGGILHIETRYTFADGRWAVATGSWNFPRDFPFRMTAQVLFESATAVFSTLDEPTLTVYEGVRPTHPPVPEASAYTEELRHFVECIAAGRPSDRMRPEEAAAAVATVEAEIESVRTGRPVAPA